jgi:microcystin-dependent protein
MPFWIWSKTASSNANADPTISWAEGMSPSSVNDSGRSMMARAAEYRDDISGSVTTGGSATAYTLTTNQGLAATPNTGQLIAFTVHATNGIAPTLTTDGGNTYPLMSDPSNAIGAGALVLGTPYTAKFNGSQWIMRNFYGGTFSIPLGGIMAYIGSTAPNSNFALPFGQAISRTTYAALFSLIGTTYGSGDGITTFNIPDLRGRMLAGVDNMGGSAASRLTTTYFGSDPTVLGNTGGSENHTLVTAEMPVTTPAGSINNVVSGGTVGGTGNAGVAVGAIGVPLGNSAIVVTSTFTGTPFGSGSPHAIVPPAMVTNFLLRIF